MWGVDYKKRMEDILFEDVKEYLSSNGLDKIFEMPILGYADANDPVFLACVRADLTQHPKEIYRPGQTVIVNFLPFSYDFVKSNFRNDQRNVSEEWTYAYEKSIMVSSHINGVIMESLVNMGREVSLTNLPSDWDEDVFGPNWSHKIAAYIAGMGTFGPTGCLMTKAGSMGRFNSVITELPMEYTGDGINREDIAENIRDASTLQGEYNKSITKDLMDRCPAGAIISAGIDRNKCQVYCGSLGQTIPEPEVCGKCFPHQQTGS